MVKAVHYVGSLTQHEDGTLWSASTISVSDLSKACEELQRSLPQTDSGNPLAKQTLLAKQILSRAQGQLQEARTVQGVLSKLTTL